MIENMLLTNGRLPNGWTPYEHQLSAADQIIQNRHALLSFDVGCGKTLTATMAGMAYQKLTGGRTVVIAPASLQVNWRRETQGLLDPSIHSAGKIPTLDDLGSEKFFLVLDEAHYYQNPSSKRTQAVRRLAQAAQGVLPMTATPIRNYPSNLFPLLKLIRHPLGENFDAYKRRYCDDKMSGSSNLMELHRLIQTKLIIAEKEDLLSLPPFDRFTKVVEFDAVGKYVFQKAFMDAKEQYKQRVADGTISDKGWHIVMINNLRQATAKAKAIYAVKLAKKAVDNGHQVIVFTNFKQSSNYIERWLDDYGANAVLLNGSVSKNGRQLLVDEFQSGNSKVFVMTRAGTDGLNLQKGSIAISVDRTWSPFDMLQWEGRIHRNGQENPCFSIWLQDGIIDPYIDNKMMDKYRTVRQILHGTVDDLDGVSSPRDWAERLSNWLFRPKE